MPRNFGDPKTSQYKKYRLRRRGRRLRNPRRKRGKWTKGDFIRYAGYAYTGLKLAKELKKLVNVEMKHYDQETTGQTADYNGALHYLCIPAQGDTDQARDGDSIKIQRCKVRFTVTAHASADTVMRVIIFWDKMNQIGTGADLLENVASANAPYSYREWDKRFRAKVLYDQRFILSADEAGNTQYVIQDVNFPVGMHTQFDAGATTIDSGALKIMFISDQQTNQPGYSLYSRAEFTDN